MKRRELEQRLSRAVRSETPDVLEKVLTLCEPNGRTNNMTEQIQNQTRKRKKWPIVTAIAATAACLLLIAGIGLGTRYFYGVDATIAVDVNPSIELTANRQEKVLEVRALNQDAEQVLDGMDLKGTDLNVAMNALIGSMVKHGYIDAANNSVLVSVESSSPEREQQLQAELTADINSVLTQNAISPAVLQQSVSSSEELDALAAKYNISAGRAALIQRITELNPVLTADQLAPLSVNDLSLLLLAKEPQSNLVSSGTVSEGNYIGMEKAQQIAQAQYPGATVSKLEFDYEGGRPVYEVKLFTDGVKYELDIDAKTGEILKTEQENGTLVTGTVQISSDDAKNAAFTHAGVTDANLLKLDLDRDDAVYEVEFTSGSYYYDYDISAQNGSVLKYEKKQIYTPADSQPQSQPQTQGTAAISAEQAQEIVLAQVPGATMVKLELDRDDGRMVYEGECRKGQMEYEFKLDAQTGAILEWEEDYDD